MILIDTSVWVDHLRSSDAELGELVKEKQVLSHPFVIGEIALGSYRERNTILKDLSKLPRATVARDEEVLHLISSQKMHGLGIGYIDSHLLASAKMSAGSLLWTRDKRLHQVAQGMGIAFREPRLT